MISLLLSFWISKWKTSEKGQQLIRICRGSNHPGREKQNIPVSPWSTHKKTPLARRRGIGSEILEIEKDSGIKPVFRLSPPSGGFNAVKEYYPKGDLGYRGEKINELLKRMI